MFLVFYVFKYLLLHIRPIKNAKQKILCHVNKVTTGVYVTPPPFRFQRKHNIYANLLKRPHYFCFHIYFTTHQKNGLTPKRYLAKFLKFLLAFMSLTLTNTPQKYSHK